MKIFGTFNRIKHFLYVFLPILILILSISAYLYINEANANDKIYIQREYNILQLKKGVIETTLNSIFTDILILSSHHELVDFLKGGLSSKSEALNFEFKMFLDAKMIYDQARIIDADGNERIRVNYNGGNIKIVKKNDLQNKSDRYYFKKGIELGKGEIYISRMDLNIEGGKIEFPQKPMIRIAAPVFQNNEIIAIVVLNYLAEDLIQKISSNLYGIENDIHLLNSDSYWLYNKDEELRWGFMFEEKYDISFKNYYPSEWEVISSNIEGQYTNDTGLITYSTISPFKEMSESFLNKVSIDENFLWKIVSYVPNSVFQAGNKILLINYIMVAGFLLLLSVFISGLVANLRIKNYAANIRLSQNYSRIVEQKMKLEVISAELKSANKKLTESESHLKNEIKNKDMFLSFLSHDLKSPFGPLLGYIEIIKEELHNLSKKELFEYVVSIESITANIYDLLIDLLDWSNSKSGHTKFSPKAFSTSDSIEKLKAQLSPKAKSKDITLLFNLNSNFSLYGDPTMFETVVRNLVTNALKFSHSGESILITARKIDGFVEFSVSDSGVGIKEEDIDKLFDLNEQISTAGTKDEKGTGVGLKLCKDFVERNSGKIWVESKLEVGSKFYFTFPLAAD